VNPQSWNLYPYARNNPISYTDPAGNFVQFINGQAVSKTVDGMDGELFMEGGLESMQASSKVQYHELILEELMKLIAKAKASNADAFTTAVTIFSSLGNQVTATGTNLREALAKSNVELDETMKAILANANRITKDGNTVTIANKKEKEYTIGEGKDAQRLKIGKEVQFTVAVGKDTASISRIKGVEAKFGILWPNINSIEVKTKGDIRVLEIKAGGVKKIEIPISK
jgi:hypothetical protein